MPSRGRRWCFTINNYEEENLKILKEKDMPEMRYLVCGEEVGESGTPHLQGYIELTRPLVMKQVKALIGCERAHLEHARGTGKQNDEYCKKDGKFFERGTPAAPGTRSDLKAVSDKMSEGASIRSMISDGIIATKAALGYAEAVAKYVEKERDWMPEVRWFWGPAGAGKTRAAREWLNNRENRYVKTSGSGKWWDGYDGHEDIIWDDFRDSQCPITDLLGIMDRYDHRLEIKGGIRQCRARRIAFTSIGHPKGLYPHAKGEPVDQILRRISMITHVDTGVGR